MSASPNGLIPTMLKARISHVLSYPAGAQQITAGLIHAPQFRKLTLNFFAASGFGLRDVRLPASVGWQSNRGYEFLRAEYRWESEPAEDYPVLTLHPRPVQYQWEIVVLPVRRSDRHRINKYLLEEALPRIASWLQIRAHQSQPGSDLLCFFFDETDETFHVKQVSKMEVPVSTDG